MTLRADSRPPYPVLAPTTGDYDADSGYDAEIIVRRRIGKDIAVAVAHRLRSPGIRQLLDSGDAAYAAQVKFPETRARFLEKSPQPRQEFRLDDAACAGAATVQPLVVAVRHVPNWQAPDWSARTRGLLPQGVALPPGALLAAGERRRFDAADMPSGDSIVQLAPTDAMEPDRTEIDLDGEKVVIKVNPDTFRRIQEIQANEGLAGILWPSVYQSAILQALRRHRHPDYRDRRWARGIARRLAEQSSGEPPDDADLAANDLKYAQLIMELPLGKLLAAGETQENNA